MTESPVTRPQLILIDGHALAYQQFFGLPLDRFTTSSGEPTNATFGFARTLLDLLLAENPARYLAVSFDQGDSGRAAEYPPYKAHREKMQDPLIVQMGRIRELVQAFNIPILEREGCEADDIIGAAARQATALGVDVHIITGDRDLLQLVNDHVTVELPSRAPGVEAQTYTPAAVQEKFGVRPDQIPDYKGFVGDTSDNIPGVQGIGEKTAAQLLQQYGTVEGVYEHIDEQKGARRQKLEDGRTSAFLSKKLATILTNLPLDLDLEKCAAHDYDVAQVVRLFEALEFRSLLKRLGAAVPTAAKAGTSYAAQDSGATPGGQQTSLFDIGSAAPEPIPHVVRTIVVDSEEALSGLVSALDTASDIAFDTETTATDQMRAALVGVSLAVNEEEGYYIPVGHIPPGELFDGPPPRQLPLARVAEALRPALTDLTKRKHGHNATYDLVILRRHGLDVTPIDFDTMLAEWVRDPETRRKGLKDQAKDLLNVEMTHIEDLIGARGKNQLTMDRVSVERAAPYAAADAVITLRLVGALRQRLESKSLLRFFHEVEMPLVPVIADLNLTGARLDLPYLAELGKELTARMAEQEAQIHEQAGEKFNIGSLKKLNEILFEKLGLSTRGLRKSAHGYSLDADALDTLSTQHPIVNLILDWRSLEKLRSTYVEALPAMVDSEGRIHTTYNQAGSVTGRLSSENPNLQNIPIRTEEGRRVRKAFIAPAGRLLLSVDYSQIELRILAHYSQDTFLIDAFRHDLDIHSATAAAVMNVPLAEVTKEQRYFAKRINFGLLYGMGAARLARESGLPRADAEEFIRKYFERLPGVKGYLDSIEDIVRRQGYLETLLGRRRDFSRLVDDQVPERDRARIWREAINMPIQGTAADIIKIAMIRLSARLKAEQPRARMILQVHDELVLEAPGGDIPAVAALVREVMEGAFTLAAPLRAEANFGINWAEMASIPR